MTYIYMLIYYSKIYWSVLGSILTPPLTPNATLITCDGGVGRHTRGPCWHGHTRAACWVLWVCGTNVTVKPTPARPDATLPATWTLFRNVLNTPRTTPSTEHTGRLRQPVRVCLSVPQKVRLHWLIIVTLTQQTAAIYKKRSTQLLSLSGVYLKK